MTSLFTQLPTPVTLFSYLFCSVAKQHQIACKKSLNEFGLEWINFAVLSLILHEISLCLYLLKSWILCQSTVNHLCVLNPWVWFTNISHTHQKVWNKNFCWGFSFWSSNFVHCWRFAAMIEQSRVWFTQQRGKRQKNPSFFHSVTPVVNSSSVLLLG